MNVKSKFKFSSPTIIYGNMEVPFHRPFSCVFRYDNGQISWPLTDYFSDLQRSQLSDSTLDSYTKPLSDIAKFMSSRPPTDCCFQFSGASNLMFLEFRTWLQNTIPSMSNKGINKRLRTLMQVLFYIQDKYDAETPQGHPLIKIKGDDIPVAGVEIEKRSNPKKPNSTYFWHNTILPEQKYTPRSPITTKAIIEAGEIIEAHSKINSKQAYYNSEVLRLATHILEATGIRAGELVRMGTTTLDLLRKQLNEDEKTVSDLIKHPDAIIRNYFTTSEIQEILDVILKYMDESSEIIWLLVITNKSTVNAGKPRLLPIGRPLAQDIVDFYDDFVLDMIDLDSKRRSQINRSDCGYIIPKYDGKPFFNPKDIGNNPDEESDGDGKLFSSAYSNKVGRLAKNKISPHLFRHRYITNLVVKMLAETDNRDRDSMTVILTRVARLSGHANIESLWHYIEDGKVVLNNRQLIRKKMVKQDFDKLCEKHGQDPNSEFLQELKRNFMS
ncbi:TPA: site-specific integrase [Vibrio cholerae]|nr:site-specific integrase [Vibrio cholerae]